VHTSVKVNEYLAKAKQPFTAGIPAPAVDPTCCEYRERRITYGILFILSPFYECIDLEYLVSMSYTGLLQAEYVIDIRLAVPQEYVNTFSTRRLLTTPTVLDRCPD